MCSPTLKTRSESGKARSGFRYGLRREVLLMQGESSIDQSYVSMGAKAPREEQDRAADERSMISPVVVTLSVGVTCGRRKI